MTDDYRCVLCGFAAYRLDAMGLCRQCSDQDRGAHEPVYGPGELPGMWDESDFLGGQEAS